MDMYWARSPKMRKAGVTASLPRMVCYKMVGLDNTVAVVAATAVLAVVASVATTNRTYN